MSFAVYDYRHDIRNVLVTPEIRSRFLKMEPGQVAVRHSHDLGHEIFLILQGVAEFEIDGDRRLVRPGQLCVALTDQMHQVRVVGHETMIMYLSVTPHIQPTHSFWNENGEKEPPRFAPNAAYDVVSDDSRTAEDHLEDFMRDVHAAATTFEDFAAVQKKQARKLQAAIESGDTSAALTARDEMWHAMYPMFKAVSSMSGPWNQLAAELQPDKE